MRKELGKKFLDLTGWTLEGRAPEAKKVVMIAAPHTSNWDFPFTIAAGAALQLPMMWMGKQSLFDSPLGPVFRALGGISIDRSKSNNTVHAMIDALNERDELALLVPAEGTRKKAAYWKSGFYHIARGAHVPIVLAFIDYPQKRVGLGPTIMPTGDIRADMDKIRAFYADKRGKNEADFTVPRLREEDEVESSAA